MPNAIRLVAVTAAIAAIAGCARDQSDQNIVVDNNTAVADVEMLPPDESSATPTDQLENGTVETQTATNETSANGL